jgi:ribosomal protein L11 methyltransferase
VPYRVDLSNPPEAAFDRLVALGALDVELLPSGLAALLPDSVSAADLTGAIGPTAITVSPALGRDDGSTWVLSPQPVRAGGVLIVPAHLPAPADALRLHDGPAFGTGLHATTALCLDALEEALEAGIPPRLLDVGTGSGVLALAALLRGVPQAVGLDIDPDALQAAEENARLNGLEGRLRLVNGGPESVDGVWPIVMANLVAAPLIEMAPALVRRVGPAGRLVLSGIPSSVAREVDQAYRRCGMRAGRSESRAGWTVLVLFAGW